jgi:tRNA(Ile)-lysidine synthase
VSSPFLARIDRRLDVWRSAKLGPLWIVAVSGGSDSVGLLRVLHQLAPKFGLELSVAHLDHGVRGDSAKADAAFVADLAASLGLPIDIGQWHPTRHSGFEAEARRARYAWLAEVARNRKASVVAVGHTRDDQAETILHRVLRGTGLRGLSGMSARRALGRSLTLVRPLLSISRAEIREFLAELGQSYRDDATNADLSRTRARIRHDLLPKLESEYNPRIVSAVVRLGSLASSSEREKRRRLLEVAHAATRSRTSEVLVFDRGVLAALPPFARTEVLRLVWRRAGWPEAGMDAERWRRLTALATTNQARIAVVGGVEAVSDQDLLTFHRRLPACTFDDASLAEATLDVPGSVSWQGGRLVAAFDRAAPRDESVDFDQLATPLLVRGPRPGDRFEPLGMGGRSTPLNDFFRGRGVARHERPQVPLLCDRVGIVWVVGHRIAERARLTESTQRPLGLRWEPVDEGERAEPPNDKASHGGDEQGRFG